MNLNEDNTFIINDFDEEMERSVVLPLTLEVQKQSKLKEGRIDLWISSFGGYVHLVSHLIELVELAKRNGVVVRTMVPSVAYSAGSILACTGTPGERYIGKGGEHLIHYGRTGSVESTPEQVERNFVQKTEHFKRIRKHYQEYTKLDSAELDRLMNDDSAFIPAAKCIKWGLADKYMDRFDLLP